jgi:hypothetical protein
MPTIRTQSRQPGVAARGNQTEQSKMRREAGPISALPPGRFRFEVLNTTLE